MTRSILPHSHANFGSKKIQPTYIAGHFRVLGARELRLDSPCAREGEGHCIQRIFARVFKLLIPILPKKRKRVKKQGLTALVCLGGNGSVGGWA